MPKKIEIELNADGTFSMGWNIEAEDGTSSVGAKTYTDKQLILVLKDVVQHFRGYTPNLTVIPEQVAVVPQPAAPAAPVPTIEDPDDYVSTHYNGGLGPRIAADENVNGFGNLG